MLPAKHIHIDDDSASILSFRTNSTSSSFNLSHRSSESYYQSSISKFALKLPDRKQLAGPILDQAIKSIKQLRKEKLNQVHKQAGITLSFNGWKNIVNQELLGIMIILPSGETLIWKAVDISDQRGRAIDVIPKIERNIK
ncbi:uncharacterized protein OCT59_009674 [Rhizophagus irregularis]|uniref:uncharacterized protein n=1 Tax=Rhizophagus irregularis TaxID=588596 RepID=UPI00331B43C7|nr:hypothetical protein OCT59_009674 [Rhizophagus irregularis]